MGAGIRSALGTTSFAIPPPCVVSEKSKLAPRTTRSRWRSSAARKRGSPSFGLVEDHIEHDHPRAGGEEPVQQSAQTSRDQGNGLPSSTGKRDCPPALPAGNGGNSSDASSIPRKTKSGLRRGLAAFALEQILVGLFAPPDRGEKGNCWKMPAKDDEPRAERANRRDDQPAMAAHPMHGGDFRSRAPRQIKIVPCPMLPIDQTAMNLSRSTSTRFAKTSCDLARSLYFSGPRTPMRLADPAHLSLQLRD